MNIELDPRIARELGPAPTLAAVDAWGRALRTSHDASMLGAICGAVSTNVERGGVRASLRWAGVANIAREANVIVCVQIATRAFETIVVAAVRGFERALTIPARAGVIAETLVEMLEERAALSAGSVYRWLHALLRERLRAAPPARSLGRWVVDCLGSELEGVLGEARGVPVSFARGDAFTIPALDGVHVTPLIKLGEREQQIFLAYLGADTFYEVEPDAEGAGAAIEALTRWRERVRASFATVEHVETLMPSELPWPESPSDLVVTAVRHGPCGPRPVAGELGELARSNARQLRALAEAELAALDADDVMCGYAIGRFTIVFQHAEVDGCIEERISLAVGASSFVPVVAWYPESEQAFSADADEPTIRLFADWLRLALAADAPLPQGERPSAWLRFQDRGGGPLDHRMTEGMVSVSSYAETVPDLGDGDRSAELRTFVREIIDGDARFGIAVAQLGIP